MWGFERNTNEFKIPQEDGSFKIVESEEERTAAAMIRNYWFGRYSRNLTFCLSSQTGA